MTRRSITLLVVALAASLMTGCGGLTPTTKALVPGSDTRAQVLARMGSSPFVWFDREGREYWDYSRNPFSAHGYRAGFDSEGRLVEWRELRRPEDVARLKPGVSKVEDVRDALGQPNQLQYIRGDAHWQWRVQRGTRPYRLVVQMGPDGTLKSIGEYPADRCCRGGML
jgi:hypothetical protein